MTTVADSFSLVIRFTHLMLLLSAAAMAGCAVVPTVEINTIRHPSDLRGDEIDTYSLQRSRIVIDKPGTTKTRTGSDTEVLSISSVPDEHNDFKLGLRRADSFGIKTNLNFVKIQNTDLLKEVGSEVVDMRIDLIGKLGALVTRGILGTVDPTKALSEELRLPKHIDVSDQLKSVEREPKNGVDAGNGVLIDFGALPKDAGDFAQLNMPLVNNGLIYAACRSATVRFKYAGADYTKTLKVSDPRYYQRVSFPIKGKISFHSECGASVTSEKDTGVSPTADIVEAIGKAISEVMDATKK